MVRVRVRLMGFLSTQAGVEETEVELKGRTVGDLMRELVGRFGRAFKESVIDPALGTPAPRVIISVNGVEVGCLRQLDTELRNGDVVDIIPIVHGG